MIKFKRKTDEVEKLYSKWFNSFQFTGFLNEKLLNSPDRDFWQAMFNDVFTDCYTSSIYEGVLVAYKEIPYSEAVLQNAILLTNNDEDIYKPTEDVYASLYPSNVKIYRCMFAISPVNSPSAKVGAQLYNTLEKLKRDDNGNFIGEFAGWTPVPNVLNFFETQLSINEFNVDKFKNDETLLAQQPVTIIVPIQERTGYYNINGQDRRPLLGETFYYNKTIYGQLKFLFKTRSKRNFKIYDAYFSVGIYTKNNYNKEIFYIKFFKEQFVNPLLVFEEYETEELMKHLLKSDLSPKTREILLNTYECYLLEVDQVRTKYKNKIPTLVKYIQKPDDEGFEKKKQQLLDERRNNIDYEYVEDVDDILMDEDLEEVDGTNSIKTDQPFTVNRNTITLNLLYKLIMGYDGKTCYSFYSHLGTELLKITDMSKSGYRGGSKAETSVHPRGMQIFKTMASNSDIMMTNDNCNPIDIFRMVAYKKKILEMGTNSSKGGGKSASLPDHERYRYFGVNYGIIDSHTVKSPKTSGIQGNANILQFWADRFIYRDEYEVKLDK